MLGWLLRGLVGLKVVRRCSSTLSRNRSTGSSVGSGGSRDTKVGINSLYQQIKFSGPITVAEYMKQCLLNPVFGYYMQGDVFGAKGDFVTSPEVSQVFGELLAVWVLSDWLSHGKTTPLQLVELGPGRGSLLHDIMRVFQLEKLRSILEGLSLHLVEASPALAAVQEKALQATPINPTHPSTSSTPPPYRSSEIESVGVSVSWYQQLRDVPQGHAYFIAHELFDALPIHQFQMTSSGWREVLVDIDPTHTEPSLRFVLSPSPTPASALYTHHQPPGEEGAWLEVCPQGITLAQELSERVLKAGGGAALVADYGSGGDSGGRENTLRSFRKHQQQDVLERPGMADLTADVNFTALAQAAIAKGAGACGPISQNQFLHQLGIRERIEALLKQASPSSARDLVSSYEMLTSPQHMGQRFQFLTITSSPKHVPLPFDPNQERTSSS